MLHRPLQQELIQLLQLQRRRRPPPQILRRQPQMVRAGLGTPPIRPDHLRIDPELRGQPRNGCRRRGRHIVRHEPQPRQRSQRHRQPEPIRRALPPPGSTNTTSAGVKVKNRNSSSLPISGNRRSPSNSSSVNTGATTSNLPPESNDLGSGAYAAISARSSRVLRRPQDCLMWHDSGHLASASNSIIYLSSLFLLIKVLSITSVGPSMLEECETCAARTRSPILLGLRVACLRVSSVR